MQSARDRWLEALRRERARREAGALQIDGVDAREWLLERLATMRSRLVPADFELSPAEAAVSGASFSQLLRDHGYGRSG